MAWKTVVGVLFITTIILGTYLKFFDHPAASETMDANRMIHDMERPSFIKKVHQSAALKEYSVLKNQTKELNSSTDVLKIVSNKSNSDIFENKTMAPDEERLEQLDSEEVDDHEGALVKDGRGPHGIKLFDWDNWVKENDFVNIGSLWAYCDDDDPPLVGKVVLFNNGGTLSLVLVLNTTFEADIAYGKVEVKVLYSDAEFYHKIYDVCDMAANFEDDFFQCPMAKGDKYFFKEQTLSRFLPSGTYSVEMSLRNEYENTVICGQCKFII